MLRVGDTSSNNTFTGNTFITNSGSEPSYQDEGTGNVFTDNMFSKESSEQAHRTSELKLTGRHHVEIRFA